MCVSTMKSVNYPLALPLDFLDEFKQVAKEAGLSTAATIRQSAKLGLPKFREQISSSRVTNVAPLPDKVARKLYAERAEDMDSIRRFIAAQPKDVESTMTLTADSKGRIACRDLFPPHASFEARKEPDGRVTLIRLRREDRKPRLVKPVVRKGLLVLPMENAELDSEALDREIREERERENARLLG